MQTDVEVSGIDVNFHCHACHLKFALPEDGASAVHSALLLNSLRQRADRTTLESDTDHGTELRGNRTIPQATETDHIENQTKLGQPLHVLRPVPCSPSSPAGHRTAVVGDLTCVTLWGKPYLWIYDENLNLDTRKLHTIPGLEALSMAAMDTRIVILGYPNTLYIVTIDQKTMGMANCTVAKLGFNPVDFSFDPKTPGQLVFSTDAGEIIQWDFSGKILETTSVGSVTCALATDGGYAALDKSGALQWVDRDGTVVNSYQGRGGDLVCASHMAQDSRGRLVVADTGNHRLHLVGVNSKASHYLLTREDGIEYPSFVCLDEVHQRLLVSHHPSDGYEIRAYRWPMSNNPTRSNPRHSHSHPPNMNPSKICVVQ